jgi:hypothetical protein
VVPHHLIELNNMQTSAAAALQKKVVSTTAKLASGCVTQHLLPCLNGGTQPVVSALLLVLHLMLM